MANQGDFSSGDVLTAADLNGFTQVTALADSTSLSIPATTVTPLTYTSEIIDVGGWHSTSTNTARITPTLNGVYLIVASVSYNHTGASYYFESVIRKNGSTALATDSVISTYYPQNSAAVVATANGTTDYFDSYAYHTGGAAIPVFQRSFSVTLLRAL